MTTDDFEIVIIGGGINGVAIARECARAGRRTLLVEQHDFAAGTTSRSTRIIHGGLRYLEYREIGLVRESLRESERLLRRHPHLVRPSRFLLALPPGRRSALEVRFGLWLYRRFSQLPATSSAAQIAQLERLLDGDGSARAWSVFSYDDAQCEFPERLVATWLVDALAAGAFARNHTEALAIETAQGRATGVRLRDRLDGREFSVRATWIINASGPWADRICAASHIATRRPMIGAVRGSHLVLPRFAGAPDSAIYTEAVDGRPIFLIPWNDQLLLGTTEVADSGDPAEVRPSAAESEYLLSSLHRLLPATRLGWADVRHSFAGLRPLPYTAGKPASAITRRHFLHDHAPEGAAGMISVIGGKLTTAASLARQCARRLGIRVPEPQLAEVLIADVSETLAKHAQALAQAHGLPLPSARAIVDWFGERAAQVALLAADDPVMQLPLCAHTPHIVAEAAYAVRQECAVTLGDILLRRVPVALGACWSPECTRTAAHRIAAALAWPDGKMAAEMEGFEEEKNNFLIKSMPELSHTA